MTQPLKIFDLFGEPALAAVIQRWPQTVQPLGGMLANWPPPDFDLWLTDLNNSVEVRDVRTAASEERVAVEAKLTMTTVTSYLEGFPFVLASMPDVEFRVQYATALENQITMIASVDAAGALELVLEAVPVEILLPSGFIEPHPEPGGDVLPDAPSFSIGEFQVGRLDDLKVVYRRQGQTSVFVHARFHLDGNGEFEVRPAVPISFGRCLLSGIPCLAVHDLQLIPSPGRAPRGVPWLRHEVTPWAPQLTEPLDGCVSIRSVHLDPDTEPLHDFADWLNAHRPAPPGTFVTPPDQPLGAANANAEFVLNDLVVPLFSPWGIPLPRHATVGLRRSVLNPEDLSESQSFASAPVRVQLSANPHIELLVESLFFRSQPGAEGLTFDTAFVFGSPSDDANSSQAVALGLSLEEGYSPVASYRRDIDPVTQLPVIPNTGNEILDAVLEFFHTRILHAEVATITLDVVRLRFGVSLMRWFGEERGFSNSFEASGDILVHMPPSGGETIGLRSLNGQPTRFIAESVGWRHGSLSLGGLSLPDGVVFFVGPVGIVIQEVAVVAESGATYLMVSGGVDISPPAGWSVSFLLKRLRMKMHGAPTAPAVKVDGFALRVQTTGLAVEAAGYFTVSRTPELTREEVGLSGSLFVGASTDVQWGLSIDLLLGRVTTPTEKFSYGFGQVVMRGSIPIYAVELVGIRALYANNMKPKLSPVDRESRDLRYYRWYRENDPLTVPGDRRLASWESARDAWAFGLGCGLSVAGFGSLFRCQLFVLTISAPDERGVLIAVEVRLGKNPNPIGYLALEFDREHGRFSGVLGVALRLENFVESAPSWLSDIGQLTGTLFVSNDPNTFAIGRLSDQRTWLGLRWDFDWWATIKADFILCLELVEGGPHGLGLAIRLAGGFKAGPLVAEYTAGIGFSAAVFTSASSDYAVVIWIDFAFRVKLFRFLRFGVSAGADLRSVGARPSRGELRVELRFETPWYMPDVTWTWELSFGSLAPADLATATNPLRVAAAGSSTQQGLTVHIERFDQGFSNDGTSRTFSINQLRAGTASEATRLAHFAANQEAVPIATDSTISVDWAVPVNDHLGLGSGLAVDLGDQLAGDLGLTYSLVGLRIRRRPRFAENQAWVEVDERTELPLDFNDPDGVQLSGGFDAQVISAQWDLDVRVAGQPVAKRLLLNSSTPFQYVTADPRADEELVASNPSWPCCREHHEKEPVRLHELAFRSENPGTDIEGTRAYEASHSTLRFRQVPVAAPSLVTSPAPPVPVIARFLGLRPGIVAQMTFDTEVAYSGLRLGWKPQIGQLALLAFDAAGNLVGSERIELGLGAALRTIVVGGSAPIRRVELRYTSQTTQLGSAPQLSRISRAAASTAPRPLIEMDSSFYLSLRDLRDWGTGQACEDGSGGAASGYEGHGKLFFLPNHEYEVALTTRVSVEHPSTTRESTDLTEYLYFATKGLPGLNATQRVGEELEPHLRGAYSGGRGLLYREEPIVVALDEDYSIALPLDLRTPGSTAEQAQLLRMQLAVRPEIAATTGTALTTTSEDWIVSHRTLPGLLTFEVWRVLVSHTQTSGTPFRSRVPQKARLARLTQRELPCHYDDPREVNGTVLVAEPQGTDDPENPGQQLWPSASAQIASVKLEGAPFVHRDTFVPADLTALRFATATGNDTPWSVDDGRLISPAGPVRRYAVFGDSDWNHLEMTVLIELGNASAGVALSLPSAGGVDRCLMVWIEDQGNPEQLQLVVARCVDGAEPVELAQAELEGASRSEPISLTVSGFDDRIRAVVGEVEVEASRGAWREGRVALVAAGEASFRDLRVQGLELLRFPVSTSRFRGFNEHIASWPGELHELTPDAMGPATSSQTVADLWLGTRDEVLSAMQKSASAQHRDEVFAQWVVGLGLPLRQVTDRLDLSLWKENGQTRGILLESPEPIDFVSEVALQLERRTGGASHIPWGSIEDFVDHLMARPLDGPRKPLAGSGSGTATPPRFDRADLLHTNPDRDGGSPDRDPSNRRPARARIVSVNRRGRRLDVTAVLESRHDRLVGQQAFLVERQPSSGFHLYRGRVLPTASGRLHIRAELTEPSLPMAEAGPRASATIPSGLIFGAIASTGSHVLLAGHSSSWQSVDLQVIQDGGGTRAILLPMESSQPSAAPPGQYRLSFELSRARWETTAPADDINHYQDSARLDLSL